MTTFRKRRYVDQPRGPTPTQWRYDVTDAINALPPTSTFSFTTPNSNVTGDPGTLGVNYASNVSVFWVKQVGSSNTGWVAIA